MRPEDISIIDGTPMFADVVSGAIRRPSPPDQRETWPAWAERSPALAAMRRVTGATEPVRVVSDSDWGPLHTALGDMDGQPNAAPPLFAVGPYLCVLDVDGCRAAVFKGAE